MVVKNTLINRSSRRDSVSNSNSPSSSNANGKSSVVPLRRPHDGSSPNNFRHNNDGDDDRTVYTVKSNTGIPVQQQHSPLSSSPIPDSIIIQYILPCFRIRSRKSAIIILVISALFISIQIIAYRSISSIPNHEEGYFLPEPRRWEVGRERRRIQREERRANSNHTPISAIKSVKYTEYEKSLLTFLFSLRATGVKSAVLPLKAHDPLGQDMSVYSTLGCSVFNQLSNSNNKNNNTFSHKEQMQQLWLSHIPTILQASRHADDTDYVHEDWTATLLKSISPYSILDHLPNDNSMNQMSKKDIERIIGILMRRLLGLFQSSGLAYANMPPPLRIAVFGGPTVEGMGCSRARVDIPRSSMSSPIFCSFPHRLEHFLNEILLPPTVLKQLRKTMSSMNGSTNTDITLDEVIRLVEIINLGEEGTNSEYSTAIVRNRMYPPLVNNAKLSNAATGYGGGPPDLVIDAYGIDEYGRDTTELHVFDDNSISHPSFRKECSEEYQKPPPVIVRVVLEDDNVPPSEEQFVSSIMTAVLGDVIDDVEEAETSLPDVQNAEDGKGEETTGAFGMAGHVASSWTIAYNLAFAAMSHCSSINNQPLQHPPQQQQKNTIQRTMHNFASAHCDNGVDSPCTFSFLAGPKGTALRPSSIASTLMPYMVENTGWQPESDMTTGFARKTGLVGVGKDATMTLLFRNITRPVRRFDVISLRSTSDVWKDGVAQFTVVTRGNFTQHNNKEDAEVSATKEIASSFEISAELIAEKRIINSDGKDKHISYHFGIDLPEAEGNPGNMGTDVLVRIILTKGSRFKILGLMLCE